MKRNIRYNSGRMFSVAGVLGGMVLLALVVAGCSKSDRLGPDPYEKTVEPLVQFLDIDPSPVSGVAGERVTFFVRGLSDIDQGQFEFYINQEKAEVVSVVDSAVTVVIPEKASSGAASLLAKGENYFGPIFQVDGYARIDPTFNAGSGIMQFQAIHKILELSDGYLLFGNFNNFNGNATEAQPINGIAKIDKKGTFVRLAAAGKAAEGGTIATAVQVTDESNNIDYVYVGGSFSGYNIRDGIRNITRLTTAGALDTMEVELINLNPDERPQDGQDTVPYFNGGVNGPVNYLFDDGKGIVAIGAFQYYYSYYYQRSTVGNLVQDQYRIGQFVRMHLDGSLDSSYNFDPLTGYGNVGTNGYILGATQLEDKRIIVTGSFSRFNNVPVGRIAMLAEDGTLDASFNAGGSGANGEISSIHYNKNTHKIMITGAFTTYNGQTVNGVAMLNEDGSLDPSFVFGRTSGGAANFAAQLSNGMVLVTGLFDHYDGIFKQGMLFLNADGTLAAGYNNMGAFSGGFVSDIYEAPTDLGTYGVILVGSFSQVDNKTHRGIIKIELQ